MGKADVLRAWKIANDGGFAGRCDSIMRSRKVSQKFVLFDSILALMKQTSLGVTALVVRSDDQAVSFMVHVSSAMAPVGIWRVSPGASSAVYKADPTIAHVAMGHGLTGLRDLDTRRTNSLRTQMPGSNDLQIPPHNKKSSLFKLATLFPFWSSKMPLPLN
jgi:hypothetical protein